MIFITEYFIDGISFTSSVEANSWDEAEIKAVGQTILGLKVGEEPANDNEIANAISFN